MPRNYGSLVKEAVALLERFCAGRQCLDDFVEDVSKDLQNMAPQHRSFMLDTVCGCVEHKQLLDEVVSVFCNPTAECVSKSDLSMYLVVCYLTTFSLDELGLKNFRSIVRSLGVHKVQKFLLFFLSHLTTLVQERWNRIYDSKHVETRWIQPLLRWCPDVMSVLEQLSAQVSSEGHLRRLPVKTTTPQEFSLTKPKPRALPLPELIPEQERHRAVPKTTYKAPKERQRIEEVRRKNQQKTEELLNEANTRQFRCVNPTKSQHYQKVVSEIQKDLVSKLKFNSFQSSRLPSSTKQSSWDIKLNSAAILRQGALVDRQVKQEMQRMDRLVGGSQEPSSFLQWQTQMRERDLQEQLALLERRRLEGRISHEEAAMARTRLMTQNQRNAHIHKQEVAELMRKYADTRLQEEKEMRELVQQVSEGHKNSRAAREKIQAIKQKIVKEVSEQSQELLRQALEEAQAELSRKFEIIREIHALESMSRTRSKYYDDTETGGHDLLGEMSLAELRERLALLKEAQVREEQERRENIQEHKNHHRVLLQQHLHNITTHKSALAQAAAHRKQQMEALRRTSVVPDETILSLRRTLENKRLERRTLRQADHRTTVCPLEDAEETLNKMSCEEREWEELKQSLHRHIQKDLDMSQM